MAILNLKDVTVARLNNSGFGFSVLEQNESKGKTYKTYFSIWATEPHGLSVGDVISLSGFMSAKVGEPKTGTDGVERRYAEISINSPRFETHSGHSGPVRDSEPVSDGWGTDTSSNLPDAQTGAQGNWSTNAETPF